MKPIEHLKLIDKFLTGTLDEQEKSQLQELRQNPNFEDTFELMQDLKKALRYVKLSEKLTYLKYLEVSLSTKYELKANVSEKLRRLLRKIEDRILLLFTGPMLRLVG